MYVTPSQATACVSMNHMTGNIHVQRDAELRNYWETYSSTDNDMSNFEMQVVSNWQICQ